jgi:ABC-2 type transport system ATP-binding protein
MRRAESDFADRAGPTLRISGATKVYPGPVRAVEDLDLEVARGDIFGLLGPNGAGKTTTVGMCTTLLRPTSGLVEVTGLNVTTQPARVRAMIGSLSTENTLDYSLSVRDNLVFHGRYFGMTKSDSARRADELLHRFELVERARLTPWALSTGMAKRLELARAVMHTPAVLFLDEPTSGLDPQSRLAFWDYIGTMRADDAMTVILTTHYIEEAERYCDNVAIIDHGRIIERGRPDDLIRRVDQITTIDVTLERGNGDVAELLGRIDGVEAAESHAGRVRVRTRTAVELLPRMLRDLAEYGPESVSVSRPSLENVFVSLTGRGLRD